MLSFVRCKGNVGGIRRSFKIWMLNSISVLNGFVRDILFIIIVLIVLGFLSFFLSVVEIVIFSNF